MTIKYLIVDPSFFVRKNGLRKISRLEEKIAKFELSKLSASNSPNTSGLEVETTGRNTNNFFRWGWWCKKPC